MIDSKYGMEEAIRIRSYALSEGVQHAAREPDRMAAAG
jgi:hypothetical protein